MKKKFYVFHYHWGNDYQQVWVEDGEGRQVWWDNGRLVTSDYPSGNAYNGGNTDTYGPFHRKSEIDAAVALIDAKIKQWRREDEFLDFQENIRREA